MELKDLILKSLLNKEVISQIAEAIKEELIQNQNQNFIETLEVTSLTSGSRTLLADYPNLESAIEESIEKVLILSDIENETRKKLLENDRYNDEIDF